MAFVKSVGAGRSVLGLCRQEGEIRLRCLRRNWPSNARAGFYPTACLVLDLGGSMPIASCSIRPSRIPVLYTCAT